MTISITLQTDNSAFDNDAEALRILRAWIARDTALIEGRSYLRDINGNLVGSVTVQS